MKNLLLFIALICISLGNINCKNGSCRWAPPPNVFYFLIENNGERLPDSVILNTKMYYINEAGQKVYRLSPTSDDTAFMYATTLSPTSLYNTGVMANGYVYGNPPETWYFEYPDGDIDTLYVEAIKINCKEGQQNRCYCENPYTTVKFNGHDAPEVADLHTDDGKPIFLFEK